MSNPQDNKGNNQGQGPNQFNIIINAKKHTVVDPVLTYADIVRLSGVATGDNIEVTITYKNAESPKRDGSVVAGGTVTVKNGTIFNVSATNKS